jgi:dienelactone hydrolase
MWRTRLLVAAVLAGVVLVAAACGEGDSGTGGGSSGIEVTSEVVSHQTTQDILLFEPDAEGPWPVVLAMHGVGGEAQDMAEIATRLAQHGAVVFAPTYHTDLSTEDGINQAALDLECGYRFARSIAPEHGGDLTQPVTFVGWSLGATAALAIGLTEELDPTGEFVTCFSEVPRPDVIVAISGCHYEYEGKAIEFDTAGWSNEDADVRLVAGEEDSTCAAWQSQDAEADLRELGYDVDLVILEGANHYAPVFHDVVDGEWVVDADDPVGERTVEVILDAIASAQSGT